MKIPDQTINFKLGHFPPGLIIDRLYEEIKKNTDFNLRSDISDILTAPLRNRIYVEFKSFLIDKTYEDYIQCNKTLLD